MEKALKNLLIGAFIFGCTTQAPDIGRETSKNQSPVPVVEKKEAGKIEEKQANTPEPGDKGRVSSIRKVKSSPASSPTISSLGEVENLLMGSGRGIGGAGAAPRMAKFMAAGVGGMSRGSMGLGGGAYSETDDFDAEAYDRIYENAFRDALRQPLSTFSIDVDAASYANTRRFLNRHQLPPADAVRLEELINYFSYTYDEPNGSHPFSITAEVSQCPWAAGHKLVHIGLKGRTVEAANLPASNLVFLLDVSGSMESANKLGLMKKALRLLVNQLRDEDRVSIVVYAGAAGMVLEPTAGHHKTRILESLENLRAGGSTAGGAGIQLAYKLAENTFIKGGNNRVILATDGDFNVGVSGDGALTRIIEEKRESGVYLTVLGFGMGNYKDSKMEKLADKGNGNYAYIDNLLEAKKVLVKEIGATLLTIAKDVKIQVEFNPARVNAYRLIGYENRMLKAGDFNDDKKDAGELGAGHTVTALYEIVPAGVKIDIPSIDTLKYQKTNKSFSAKTDEILTVKFRYKAPEDSVSQLIVNNLKDMGAGFTNASENFRFSAAVAGFGMLLRKSKHKGQMDYDRVLQIAKSSKGKDQEGYRSEFIRMIELAQAIEGGK